MSLRNILRGVVALVRKGKPGPAVYTGGNFATVTMSDSTSVELGEYIVGSGRQGVVQVQRPAAPRPPTVREMAEGKRP